MKKKSVLLVLILISLIFSGCNNLYYNQEIFEINQKKQSIDNQYIPIERPGTQLQVVVEDENQSNNQSFANSISKIPENLAYQALSEKEKQLLNCIYEAWITGEETDFDASYSYQEIEKIANIMYEQEPYLTSFTSGYIYSNKSIEFERIYSKSTEEKYRQQVEEELNKILKNAPSGDYEKVKYFHDYLIKNCTYVSNEHGASPYGTLIKKKAICQGYAHTFLLLCQKSNIPCVCVTGTADGPHMWNKAKINGKWYNIDVTWDDDDFSDFPSFISYDYFLIPDKDISTRTVKTINLPSANSIDDNFHARNNYYISNVTEAYDKTIKAYRDAINNKSTQATIKFANRKDYETIKKNYTEQHGLYNIQTDIAKQGYNINARQMLYLENEETLTLTFFIFYK